MPNRLPALYRFRGLHLIVAVLFVTGTMSLCTCGWVAYRNLRGIETSDTFYGQALRARLAAEALPSTLKDAEAGQRGYLLTGDPAFLAPYLSARDRLGGDIVQLRQNLLGNPARATHIDRLQTLVDTKLTELGRAVALREAGQQKAALEDVQTNVSMTAMDLIGVEINWLQIDRSQRIRKTRWATTLSWIILTGLAMLASLLFAGTAYVERRARVAVAAGFARLNRFTRAFGLAQGMVRGLDGRIIFWNEGAESLYGFASHEALGQFSHELLQTRFPEPRAVIEATLARNGRWEGELVHRRKDGSELTVASHWALHAGEAGEPAAVIEVNNDVTALILAKGSAKAGEAMLRAIIDTAPGVIYVKDLEGRMVLVNKATLALLGKSWAEVEGRTDADLLDDQSQGEAVMENDRRVLERGFAEETEELVGSSSGRPRVWLSTKTPLRAADGRVTGLVGVSVEITDRKQTEVRLQLLVHELNHRVKNTLATVQAIAAQSLRGVESAIRDILEGRLQALSAAHDVLTRENWEGADLGDIVAGALSPHGGAKGGRFVVSGPRLRLQPCAALALVMGLHELATNAFQYGSLASATGVGRVELHWTVGQGRFRLEWAEHGGAPVAYPERRGFGSRLIERSLAQDVGGSATMNFLLEGLVCVIDAPLAALSASAGVVALPRVGFSIGSAK